MSHSARTLGLLLLSLAFLSACTNTRNESSLEALDLSPERQGIVLMPIDAELYRLTAGGAMEPQAQWTKDATAHMLTAVEQETSSQGITLVHYDEPPDNSELHTKLNEILALHGAVGGAILQHKLVAPLATKKDVFDWTLGPDVQTLGAHSDANYGLFLYVRDSYSTAGRVFMQMAAALLGVGIPGGQQVGFASLVDLRSGDVVWFNFLHSTTGDLRTAEPAMSTVQALLKDMPR